MVRCPHRLVTFVAAFLLVLCTLGVQGVAPGVSPASASAAAAAADAQEEQARFDAWLDQLFRNEIVRDTIMLHAVLVRPAELGIDDYPLVLPAPLSAGDVQRDREETQAQLDELRGFETSLLTDDQQLVYALIEETAEWGLGLQEMDLLPYEDCHPMGLSGGQKQRVAVASAIASERPLILFDEPTSGLDLFHMRQVASVVGKVADTGRTALVVTHDPEFILQCCNYVLRLENGQIQESYSIENNDGRNRLLKFFLNDMEKEVRY